MPNQHDNTRIMRVPLQTYEQVRAMADTERRTMAAQLAILVEAGLRASGVEVKSTLPLPRRQKAPARRTSHLHQ